MALNKTALETPIGEASLGLLFSAGKELADKQWAALNMSEQLIGMVVDGTIPMENKALREQFAKIHAQILEALQRPARAF